MTRSPNGTRKFGDRYFDLFQVHYGDKEAAQRQAEQLRNGEIPGLFGYQGPHYARVVRYNYHEMPTFEFEGDTHDLNDWAVYIFPADPRD